MLNKIIGGVTKIFKNQNKYYVKGREYVEEKLVGEGGYGYVYIVVDSSNDQKYALKRMNISSNEALVNIKREIELWSKINNNENIVKLIDYEIQDKSVNILMELCSEGTLLEYINNTTNAITEKQILYILNEICKALLHMHSQERPIIHRDIKIENVLKFGKRLKLCDFGSATNVSIDMSQIDKNAKLQHFSSFDKTTTFIYRPPEMCDQSCNFKINEKVDIWMLGCILYTLIYKKHPFQDAQKLTIINAQYFTPETNYSEKLLDFMRLMLTPNPDKRPDTKKVIQIIQGWDSINKIELCKEVLELKAKQIDNNKKSGGDLLTDDEILRIQAQIRADEEKKRKKNPYKYKNNDDNTDVNEIFGDLDETKDSKISEKKYGNLNSNKGSNKSSNSQPFDPFGNNTTANHSKNNNMNWMVESTPPSNSKNNKGTNDFTNNNFIGFDFVDSSSGVNTNSKSSNNNAFSELHNIFQQQPLDNSPNKGFNFNNQPVNNFADFNFTAQTSSHSKSNNNIHANFNFENLTKSNNINMNNNNNMNRSKSPAVNDNNILEFFNSSSGNSKQTNNNMGQFNSGSNNMFHAGNVSSGNFQFNMQNPSQNRSKSPIVEQPKAVTKQTNGNQDIYDFFK